VDIDSELVSNLKYVESDTVLGSDYGWSHGELLLLLKAKFHYANWFEAGSKLVADRFEAGRRTSFEPASVMEFGFKYA